MRSATPVNSTMDLLIQKMVSSITELDGQRAIENALGWLRQQCDCERAMFYQFKGTSLLTFVTSNVDGRWGQLYQRGRMLKDDPVIKCYRERQGFLDWSEAHRHYPASDDLNDAVIDCELMPGLSYGYKSQCRGGHGIISVCSLNGIKRALSVSDRYLVASMVPVLHMAGRGVRFRTRGLTDREVEILQWAREGKTSWEIARIREVSESTIKYHLKAIYNKLGVTNRAQAVGEALGQGIIR